MLLPIVIGTAIGTVAAYGFLLGLVVGAETGKGIHYDKKAKKWVAS